MSYKMSWLFARMTKKGRSQIKSAPCKSSGLFWTSYALVPDYRQNSGQEDWKFLFLYSLQGVRI